MTRTPCTTATWWRAVRAWISCETSHHASARSSTTTSSGGCRPSSPVISTPATSRRSGRARPASGRAAARSDSSPLAPTLCKPAAASASKSTFHDPSCLFSSPTMKQSVVTTLAIVATAATAHAQQLPPVRQLGAVVATSSEPLGALVFARSLPGGVLVNDVQSRRVLLFDTTLAAATVVADTTSATANAYSGRIG